MRTIIVQSGQSIFDIATIVFGDASLAYNLLKENPQVESVLSDLTGMTLKYVPVPINKKEAVLTITTSQRIITMKSDQTLFDLALQYHGKAEDVYKLLLENPFIDSILDDGYISKELKYVQNNTMIPNFYFKNNITVATRYPVSQGAVAQFNYLLQEDGFYLLQENGFRIII